MANSEHSFLERNVRTRVALIRDLAEGHMTQLRLAQKYECTQPAISLFKKRHQAEIDYVKENLEDRLAGLWAAHKVNRIAAYQQDAEINDAEIAKALDGRIGVSTVDEDGNVTWERVEDVSDVVSRYQRGKHRALRSIAEERGELPARVVLSTAEDAKVHHVIVGVDMDKL